MSRVLSTTWKAWVCPECGTPTFQPWAACWHVCNDPAYYPQAFDPTTDSGVQWTRMVAVERDALSALAKLPAQYGNAPTGQVPTDPTGRALHDEAHWLADRYGLPHDVMDELLALARERGREAREATVAAWLTEAVVTLGQQNCPQCLLDAERTMRMVVDRTADVVHTDGMTSPTPTTEAP